MLFVRSCIFMVGMVISLICYIPVMLVGSLLPLRIRLPWMHSWMFLMVWWMRISVGIKHRIKGAENVGAGPYIVMSKHQSAWETIVTQSFTPHLTWVIKKELLSVPLFGWGMKLTAPIAIDRKQSKSAMNQLMDMGKEAVDRDSSIIIFPEGTRVAPGVTGKYKMGGFLLAKHTQVPIIPVAHNSGLFWGRQSFIKYPGTVDVIVGEPIDTKDKSAEELLAQVKQWIESNTHELEQQAVASGQVSADRLKAKPLDK